jgi:hypothetical protein
MAPGRPAEPGARQRLRALRMGLATVFGTSRRGFFIPYRYADTVPYPVETYDVLAGRLEASGPALTAHIAAVERLAPDLEAIGEGLPPGAALAPGMVSEARRRRRRLRHGANAAAAPDRRDRIGPFDTFSRPRGRSVRTMA